MSHVQQPSDFPAGSSPADLRQLPAHRAVREILLQLLRSIESNLPGAMEGLEPEALHDLRVAVRRTRAALGQLRGIFPPNEMAHFRSEFRWLGKATGEVRDLDVYLLNFPSYLAGLPEGYRGDLEPFRSLLLSRRQTAQNDLVKVLSSRRCRALARNWRQFLTDPSAAEPPPENALEPIGELAERRIRKLFSKVVKVGRKIDDASPPSDLHALRILCKKLRYLLEFFSGLYPPKRVGRLIGALKALQDNLGTFQDLTVQSRALRGFAEELPAKGEAPVRTLLAMGMLIENLERRRQEVRQEFAKTFVRFSRKRNRSLFKSLFSTSNGGKRND